MNDEIDDINRRNEELNQPSEGNFSKANNSSISHPDADKKSISEGIIAELGNNRIEIDSMKKVIDDIARQTNTLTQAIQQLANGQPIQSQGTPGSMPQINMESISAIGEVIEKLASTYKSLKGTPSTVADAFTQQITDNAKAEAIESLNIVHLINKKVKGKLVQDIAGDIAGTVINDSTKLDEHAPQ